MAAITLLSELPDLTTLDRFQADSYLGSLSPEEQSNLLSAASATIRSVCKRNFNSAQYSGFFDGGLYPFDVLFLPEPPVISVDRLATRPTTVLTIKNSSSANQRATVAVTSTGITLVRVASGVKTTDTDGTPITFTGNATIQALCTAINGIGNGWAATPVSGYELYPSADLKITQGAFGTIGGNGAELQMYVEEPDFAGSGVFMDGLSSWTVSSGWRLDENRAIVWGAFYAGPLTVRVDWTGGFAVIPEDIQQATVLTAIAISRAKKVNPALQSARLGAAGFTLATKFVAVPPAAREMISNYVDWAASRV